MASMEIAEQLNRLGSFELSNLAPNNVPQELITDYFCDGNEENEEDWSDDDTTSSYSQSYGEEPLEVDVLSAVATALPPLGDEDSGHENLNSDGDFVRCRVWIKNARRDDLLGAPAKKLSSSRLCSVHFETSQFTVPSERKRLNWNAVPTIFHVPLNPAPTVTHQREYKLQSLLKEPATARKGMKMTCDNEGFFTETICVNLPATMKTTMEGDQEPFPMTLFVNEAFHQTKALESSMAEEEIEQKDCQSSDFRFKNLSTHGVKPERWELGKSLCRHSNEDGVELQNENNETDYKLINDSNQIKCESEITQLDTDSLVSNDVVNIEMKVESIEEECFVTDNYNPIKYEREITQVDTDSLVSNDEVNIEMNVGSIEEESFVTDNSDEIKVEIDVCDDFESNVLYPMESEKEHNQASSNDCNDINLERDEEGDASFSSTSHTTNTDGNQIIPQDMSNSNKQEKLKDCSISRGPRMTEIPKHLWENSEIKILSTFTPNYDKRIDSEKDDKSNQKMGIKSGDENEKIFEGHNVFIDNVGLVNQNTKSTQTNSFKPINHNTKKCKCTVCDKTFTQRCYLLRHMSLHTREKRHQCTVCDKTFNEHSSLTVHRRFHTAEKPYQCTVCDKTFTQRSYLPEHMRLHTGEKPYQCTVCDKTFISNSNFLKHMRLHAGEKPYQCAVCGKTFIENYSLTVHMRQHTGEKPYQCTVCDKTFTQKSSFYVHKRVHTGDKPYKCTVCDKTFITNFNLTVHMRQHTGEKPYQCTVCDMTFTLNSSLTVHMRQHTGEKPYQCTVCDMTFTLNSSLTVHMRQHTGEKPYQCTVCDKTFTQKLALTFT